MASKSTMDVNGTRIESWQTNVSFIPLTDWSNLYKAGRRETSWVETITRKHSEIINTVIKNEAVPITDIQIGSQYHWSAYYQSNVPIATINAVCSNPDKYHEAYIVANRIYREARMLVIDKQVENWNEAYEVAFKNKSHWEGFEELV
jgi:hypothetical protein